MPSDDSDSSEGIQFTRRSFPGLAQEYFEWVVEQQQLTQEEDEAHEEEEDDKDDEGDKDDEIR